MGSSLYYGNNFYHIKWPPLNVTIFITHVRRLRNVSYANALLFLSNATMGCLRDGCNDDIIWQTDVYLEDKRRNWDESICKV